MGDFITRIQHSSLRGGSPPDRQGSEITGP